MILEFIKMQGAGNDYIYLDLLRHPNPEINGREAELARKLSDRHYGIGADGLVLILPGENADLRMRIFNADGSEAEMCGNAARCIGRYAFQSELIHGDSFTLETKGGIRTVSRSVSHPEIITVDMGPTLGNPHLVRFVNQLSDKLVLTEGPRLERSPLDRTNVEFAVVEDPHHIRMRVWERGSGETLACGTGASATAMEAVREQRCCYPVQVTMPGGTLIIDREGDHILMSGPAEIVFSGKWEG